MGVHSRPAVRVFAVLAVTLSLCLGLLAGTGYAASTVPPPPGGGPPVPGSGIGTKAAMSDPQCHTGAQFGAYGEWHTSTVQLAPGVQQFPPLCVKPFKTGDSNGGATSPGVTATTIKMVIVLPTPERAAKQAAAASGTNLATGQPSTISDAAHDWLVANMPYYQTWGRNLDVSFYQSTGADETAQRADLVAIKALHPFVVINFDTDGLGTLMNALAQAKVIVSSGGASGADRAAQAPYRWGGTDADIPAVNMAEVVGKNLAGKKAVYAGGDLTSKTRKFGVVSIADSITPSLFQKALTKYGVPKIASTNSYPSNAGAFGDAVAAQQYGPTFVNKMKAAGVTTVLLVSDLAMLKAMMTAADSQNWEPEWFISSGYQGLPILAQNYPKTQAAHVFGFSFIPPYYKLPTAVDNISGVLGSLRWFFGPNLGSTSRLMPGGLDVILSGIQAAGPKLTPQTYQQALFAAPAFPNPNHSALIVAFGFGRTTGLPYDAYVPGPADFAPMWLDPNSSCVSLGSDSKVPTCAWYMGGGRRYSSGMWPSNLKWFDKSNSISEITPIPASDIPTAAPPCPANACPSSGASGPSPGASSPNFVVVANPAARGAS